MRILVAMTSWLSFVSFLIACLEIYYRRFSRFYFLMVFMFVVTLSLATRISAETTLEIQSTIPLASEDLKGLRSFVTDVESLTGGDLKFKILPVGKVVSVGDTLKAVDEGVIDGAFGRTHFWSYKHPAAMLFGSPISGAGVGIDNIAFFSWFYNGGGNKLYQRLWEEMNLNIKGFIMLASGPETLGWFQNPIASVKDFKEMKFRTPSGIVGQTYKSMGIKSVSMRAGDIMRELEKGRIDSVFWCCPKSDLNFGIQRLLKHYYLQGSHHAIMNSDLYLNGEVFDKLSAKQKKAIEVSAQASIIKHLAYLIFENGKALRELKESYDVTTHDTPREYYNELLEYANLAFEQKARDNDFFAEVWQSQKDFANIAVPFWSQSQISNSLLGTSYLDIISGE